jgi:hypothetical protein
MNIFLLCYNESVLLPYTVAHYRKHIPDCIITIYDNESTDNSVELAKSLGCNVISWKSGNIINDDLYVKIKNSCWKSIESGWIIMADMDEWLCITTQELECEKNKGTSIISTNGINMIGESKTLDLSDIDIHGIKKYIPHPPESKKLCFLREKISDMNYNLGSHSCDPKGLVQYSHGVYNNKHMAILGLKFIVDKILKRHERSVKMRNRGLCTHYINDMSIIINNYNNDLKDSISFN